MKYTVKNVQRDDKHTNTHTHVIRQTKILFLMLRRIVSTAADDPSEDGVGCYRSARIIVVVVVVVVVVVAVVAAAAAAPV